MLSLFAFQYQCSKHSKNWLKTWLQWLQVYGSVQPVCSGFMHSTYENRMSQSCLDQELETTKHNRSLFHLSFFHRKDCQVFSLRIWKKQKRRKKLLPPWLLLHGHSFTYLTVLLKGHLHLWTICSPDFLPFTVCSRLPTFSFGFHCALICKSCILPGVQVGSPALSATIDSRYNYVSHEKQNPWNIQQIVL